MRRRLTAGLFVAGLALTASIFGLAASPALAGTLDQSQTSGSGGVAGIGIGADPEGQGGNIHQGQTFTAGLSGRLDQADLYVGRNCTSPNDGAFPSDLSVQIRTVSGDPPLPTSTVLATASVPAASFIGPIRSSPEWVTVLFPTPATVNAGTRYALVAASTGTCAVRLGEAFPALLVGYFWGYSFQDPYGGGTRVSSWDGEANWLQVAEFGEDFAFKTYVLPQAPAPPAPPAAPEPPAAPAAPAPLATPSPLPPTGERAAALKRCKKKFPKGPRRTKCLKKAKRLPV